MELDGLDPRVEIHDECIEVTEAFIRVTRTYSFNPSIYNSKDELMCAVLFKVLGTDNVEYLEVKPNQIKMRFYLEDS